VLFCAGLVQVIDSVKQTHPQLPIILYISGSGGLLERMAAANPDIISIDQSVDIVDGIKRVGSGFAIQVSRGPASWLRMRLSACVHVGSSKCMELARSSGHVCSGFT
jgi:uroporphyrinogen-III decarboxylase